MYELLSKKMNEKSSEHYNELSQINNPLEKAQLYEKIDYTELYQIIDNHSKKSSNSIRC